MSKNKELSEEEKKVIYNKTFGRCGYCGVEIDISEMEPSLINPIRLGGTYDFENILPSCKSCNYRKGTSSLEKFRTQSEKFQSSALRDRIVSLEQTRGKGVQFHFERLLKDE